MATPDDLVDDEFYEILLEDIYNVNIFNEGML